MPSVARWAMADIQQPRLGEIGDRSIRAGLLVYPPQNRRHRHAGQAREIDGQGVDIFHMGQRSSDFAPSANAGPGVVGPAITSTCSKQPEILLYEPSHLLRFSVVDVVNCRPGRKCPPVSCAFTLGAKSLLPVRGVQVVQVNRVVAAVI